MSAFHRTIALAFGLAVLAGCQTTSDKPAAGASPVASAAVTGRRPLVERPGLLRNLVRSFADSMTGPLANDGIGDFAGLIEARLPERRQSRDSHDLGITGIWPMPINPSPSYHGYDVTDYYGINPQYGTRADFERFLAECHKRGIKVIVDLVLNHSSSEHPYFRGRSQATRSTATGTSLSTRTRCRTRVGPGDSRWQKIGDQRFFGMFWSGTDLNYRNLRGHGRGIQDRRLLAERHARRWAPADAVRH
jgi:hypothetical protein